MFCPFNGKKGEKGRRKRACEGENGRVIRHLWWLVRIRERERYTSLSSTPPPFPSLLPPHLLMTIDWEETLFTEVVTTRKKFRRTNRGTKWLEANLKMEMMRGKRTMSMNRLLPLSICHIHANPQCAITLDYGGKTEKELWPFGPINQRLATERTEANTIIDHMEYGRERERYCIQPEEIDTFQSRMRVTVEFRLRLFLQIW